MQNLKEQRINEDLLSDLVLAYLGNDELAKLVINTRLFLRYSDKLVNEKDITLVYGFLL